MQDKVVAEISVVPVGTSSASVSSYIAACIDILTDIKGITYELTPMGTVMQGEFDILLKAMAAMHKLPFSMGAPRVVTSIKIDERHDKKLDMYGKVRAVQKKRGNKD